MRFFVENFLNDVISSAFKVIELETGELYTLQINANGGVFLHTPERYLSINSDNHTQFLPLNIYLNRPDIKALVSVISILMSKE
jgi:hypothetical protein